MWDCTAFSSPWPISPPPPFPHTMSHILIGCRLLKSAVNLTRNVWLKKKSTDQRTHPNPVDITAVPLVWKTKYTDVQREYHQIIKNKQTRIMLQCILYVSYLEKMYEMKQWMKSMCSLYSCMCLIFAVTCVSSSTTSQQRNPTVSAAGRSMWRLFSVFQVMKKSCL